MANRQTSGAAAFRRPSQQEMNKFRPLQFFNEIISELRKAVWPSREETMRLTWVVIVIASLIGALLGAFDFSLSRTFTRYIVFP